MSGATQLYAIAIGSNRPHGRQAPSEVVEAAIARLDEDFGLFDAAPIILQPRPRHAGRDFANSVALVESDAGPPDARRLKAIEREFGRRGGRRWGSRVLDLDIIFWWSGGKWRSRPDRSRTRPRASAAS